MKSDNLESVLDRRRMRDLMIHHSRVKLVVGCWILDVLVGLRWNLANRYRAQRRGVPGRRRQFGGRSTLHGPAS